MIGIRKDYALAHQHLYGHDPISAEVAASMMEATLAVRHGNPIYLDLSIGSAFMPLTSADRGRSILRQLEDSVR